MGIADAVAFGPDGAPWAVIDWRSDVAPAPKAIKRHRAQIRAYLEATDAELGLIVFATPGTRRDLAGRPPVAGNPVLRRLLAPRRRRPDEEAAGRSPPLRRRRRRVRDAARYSAATANPSCPAATSRSIMARAAMAPASWMVSIVGRSSQFSCCLLKTSQS